MLRNCLLLLFSLSLLTSGAQTVVFPGDANANGQVDQYDIPYIGYGIGAAGPARIQTDDSSIPQSIPQLWAEAFPDGLNLIHADVDGNGLVDVFDFFVWSENFGLLHDIVTPVELSPNVLGAPATVRWNNEQTVLPLTSGGTAEVPIEIDLPEEYEVNGLAFRLRYNPTHFNAVFFSTVDNWLKADNQGISLQHSDPGVFEVGMTRLGHDPVAGGGTCGTMSLVIIDDMIDLLDTAPDTMSTWVRLEGVQLLDGELDQIPVFVDSFELKLYRPGVVANNSLLRDELSATLYPNPSDGRCTIQTAATFTHSTVIDRLGRTVFEQSFAPRRSWELLLPDLPSGVYHVQLRGDQGVSWLRWSCL